MSTLSGLLSLVACTSLAFAAPVPKTDTFRVRGNGVSAIFVNPDGGCIQTLASLTASEATNHNGGNSNQFAGSVMLNVTTRNLCTRETLMDVNVIQLLTDSNLKVSSNLGTATLNVNATVFDPASGQTLDMIVALAWAATEGVSSGHSTSHSQFAGTTVRSSFSGANRGAQAIGRFAMLGTDFASWPLVSAYISKYSEGTVTITH